MAAPISPILDDFNRANQTPLGGSWIDLTGTSRVVSNQAALNSGTAVVTYFNQAFPIVWGLEAYASIPVKPGTAGLCSVSLLKDVGSIATIDGYEGRLTVGAGGADDTWKIFEIVNGVASEIATHTQEAASGDGIWLEYRGGVLNLYRQNGGTWTLMTSVSDATYLNQLQYGSITMAGATVRLDNFGAGAIGNPWYYYAQQ